MLRFFLRNQRWFLLALFALLQCSIFWLGRLSMQIAMLERDSLRPIAPRGFKFSFNFYFHRIKATFHIFDGADHDQAK